MDRNFSVLEAKIWKWSPLADEFRAFLFEPKMLAGLLDRW
jgi:hypothetical protein